MPTVSELVFSCHATATSKGFWDKEVNVPEKLMLIVSELSEALEAHRSEPTSDRHVPGLPAFTVELADACIRIFDLAGGLNLPLEEAILAKMEYNKSRPYRHNKAY